MSLNPQFKIVDGKRVNHKIEWTDYTWNPVGGCQHGCRWKMPDGSIAECYAEAQVNRQRSDKFYPQGFEHHYWRPDWLQDPIKEKTPGKIFLDSMSDLMGTWVPEEQIEAVLNTCRQAHWHTFQLLTKNAPRLLKFKFPPNVWVGVSSSPDFMFHKPLSPEQQKAMLSRALDVLDKVDVPIRWMSIEPLSWDVAGLLKGRHLQWAVIGAASDGPKLHQPDHTHVINALEALDALHAAVFFKGNLKWTPWREEFPAVQAGDNPTFAQMSLL